MHFQIIVFIIISIHFSVRLTQRLDSNRKTIKPEIINLQNTDDAPSPEWIKYQQERFEHNIKSQIFEDNKEQQLKTINQDKAPYDHLKQKLETSDKIETTSRQSQDNYAQEQQQKQQAEFETMTENSQHSENAEKTNSPPNSAAGIQFPSIQGFIEFLKSLKQTWMKNSIFRIDDKIKMLHNLKDSLVKTIEQQLMVLWQDDDDDDYDGNDNSEAGVVDQNSENVPKNQHNHLRRKRGILGESNINFPPDAALMSINFLTFAVFLIKLVLQVVNIIKSKHYQLSTFNMTDTGAIRYRG